MADPEWTIDELVAQVATLLGNGQPGNADRRIRQLPDRRAIRWYTTIGLLDRPRIRGRTGWYGQRHILQLVAIKRLQSAGKSLAYIQAELTGATDARLRGLAGLPDQPIRPPRSEAPPQRPAARFWTRPPAGATNPPGLRYAVDLADGVTLLLTPADGRSALGPEALSAVRDAVRPLLDVLARHGLVGTVNDPHYAEGEPL